MDKKTALIIMYASDILSLGLIGWLVVFFVGKKEVVGGRSLTTGLILGILPVLVGLGSVITFIWGILGLVKVLQGDEDPELPLIGGLNFFD